MICFKLQLDSDEFKVMVDTAWSEMIKSRKVGHGQLRPRRQAYEGVNKGYGGGGYTKPDTSVSGPTCCKHLGELYVVILYFSV